MSEMMMEALAPGLVALAASAAIAPFLNRDRNAARLFMTAVTLALLLRYVFWRVTSTLPEPGLTADFAFSIAFLVVETGGLLAAALALLFLSRARQRTPEVEANKAWLAARPAPLVDLFICTENEEPAIVERTIVGATGLDYPNARVWVLDDGRREWLRDLAERLGCRYLTRPDGRQGKTGSINNALAHVAQLSEQPELVAILDADFVPMPKFLSRSVCLFSDETVGIVQTPQDVINPDPAETRFSAAHVWSGAQRFFFDVGLPAKDAWGTAHWCGTSSVIRFRPLRAIGGLPAGSTANGGLLTQRMKEAGFTTAYLNERLTLGIAPKRMQEHIAQRARRCLGVMQAVRGRFTPRSRAARLGLVERLSLIEDVLGCVGAYPARMLALLVPVIYLLFGVKALDASLSQMLVYFLPYFLWQAVTLAWLSGGRALPIFSGVAQYVAAPAVLKAVLAGLTKPQGQSLEAAVPHGGFTELPLLRIYAGLLAVTLGALLFAGAFGVRGDASGFGGLALVWCLFNAVVLAIVCVVCASQPSRRRAARFAVDEPLMLEIEGETRMFRLVDISITGACFRGTAPATLGGPLRCQINGEAVPATVVRRSPDTFAIDFDGAVNSRVATIRSFYSGSYAKATDDVAAEGIGRMVLTRLLG